MTTGFGRSSPRQRESRLCRRFRGDLRCFLVALSFLFALAIFMPALAQDYPTRPIHALTAVSAGGTSDIFMRAMGQELGKR
jgi:tripartite-type tricarboxylate transporter receptor subunit TctC